jgi:hypothetical protein
MRCKSLVHRAEARARGPLKCMYADRPDGAGNVRQKSVKERASR